MSSCFNSLGVKGPEVYMAVLVCVRHSYWFYLILGSDVWAFGLFAMILLSVKP